MHDIGRNETIVKHPKLNQFSLLLFFIGQETYWNGRISEMIPLLMCVSLDAELKPVLLQYFSIADWKLHKLGEFVWITDQNNRMMYQASHIRRL